MKKALFFILIAGLLGLRGGLLASDTTKVVKTTIPAGPGNLNERLAAFRVVSTSEKESLKSISFNLSGTTNLSDLSAVRVYYNGTAERFDTGYARLFASTVPVSGEMVVTGNMPLKKGENWFWIMADISVHAKEGNQMGASISSFTKGDGSVVLVRDQPGDTRTILLTSTVLFSGGDGGSKSYRIPAIVTAVDGSLVTATDKRWNSSRDLPSDIDVVIRRSTDRGSTWSAAKTIAGHGTTIGFGDPALVVNRKNGEIICLFAGEKGWTTSTSAAPLRINLSKSSDNGVTWTTPVDITAQIYGDKCSNPVTKLWQGAFVTSGAALQTAGGRLMAVLAARETTGFDISNFIMYSDDNGATWQVSTNRAFAKGDEAKVTQLDNGNILMSIRQTGHRWFNISCDEGITWGTPFIQNDIIDPFCNGDLISYSAKVDGADQNRLLHSIPYASSRENVSVLLSYDEGLTWPVRKTIYSGPSAYSALTRLNDGTIGIYFEVGEYDTYQMYFIRFSLDWLTGGKDK